MARFGRTSIQKETSPGDRDVLIINKPEASAPLGLVLLSESEEDFTTIMNLKASGLIPDWNEQHPAQRLQKGDQIISVNHKGGTGQQGYVAILAELRKAGRMQVIVKRKTRRHLYSPPPGIGDLDVLVLRKPEASTPLGLVIWAESEEEFTTVMDIRSSGLVPDWNAQHPTQRLEKGDQIVAVNDAGGMGQKGYEAIISEFRNVGEMHVTVKRARDASQAIPEKKTKERLPDASLEDWTSTLPLVRVSDCGNEWCCACLSPLNSDSEVLQVPSCGHCFHLACVRKQIQPCKSLAELVCPRCHAASVALAAARRRLNHIKQLPDYGSSTPSVSSIATKIFSMEDFNLADDLPDSGVDELNPSSRKQDFIYETAWCSERSDDRICVNDKDQLLLASRNLLDASFDSNGGASMYLAKCCCYSSCLGNLKAGKSALQR